MSTPKLQSSVQEVDELAPFGSRFLTDDDDVWSQNAWDHVPPPEEQLLYVEESLERQRAFPVPISDHHLYNDRPARHWDLFYKANTRNFFKDRKWLQLEFPELKEAMTETAGRLTIFEIGCGAGNSVLPLISANRNPELHVFASDYSPRAVKLVEAGLAENPPLLGSADAFVWDLTSESLPKQILTSTVDIIVLVFVLSALHPSEWSRATENMFKLLKPGGIVLLRDYGRHDLTQVRFKKERLLQENLYVRGDKTRVYFFDLDDLAKIFTGIPLPKKANQVEKVGTDDDTEGFNGSMEEFHDLSLEEGKNFVVEKIGVDRRLLVNRKRQLKMYRVWVQAKFKKLSS